MYSPKIDKTAFTTCFGKMNRYDIDDIIQGLSNQLLPRIKKNHLITVYDNQLQVLSSGLFTVNYFTSKLIINLYNMFFATFTILSSKKSITHTVKE